MVLPLAVGGCTAPAVHAQLDGEGATEQVPAIVAATDSGTDRVEVAALVRKLDHRDPAVRAFAGEALYRISGQRFGYRYYQEPAERRTAVATYERWLAQGMPGPDVFVASDSDTDASSYSTPIPPVPTAPTVERAAEPTAGATTAPAAVTPMSPTKDSP